MTKKIDRNDPLASQRSWVIKQLYEDAKALDKIAKDSPTPENIDRAFKAKVQLAPYVMGKAKESKEKEAKFSPDQWLELAQILQEMFPQLPLPAGVQEKLDGEMDSESPKENGTEGNGGGV